MSQDIEAAIYFCCLEAFQNAAKYAGECSVTATIRELNGGVEFVVQDTGCGFDPATVEARHGQSQHGRPRRVARRHARRRLRHR